MAGITLRDQFASDYALLVSALAGLFVLAGSQTHIDYYRRRFSGGKTGYYHAFRRYFGDTLLQYLLVLPIIGAVALLWTKDPTILVAIILLVGVEKFFDEDMRHFQFTRQYYHWSASFGFRTILPALSVLAIMPLWNGRLIEVYTALSLISLATYGIVRHRHFSFYLGLLKSFAQRASLHGRTRLVSFTKRWRSDLMFNQLWTFASTNILLVDRMMVANIHRNQIDEYVFFANIFNLTNVAHSLFYFVPRRPELIRDEHASAWREIRRPANILPPLAYMTFGIVGAFVILALFPVYRDVPVTLFFGLAALYLFQAINLVGVEFVFWRVPRSRLVACDGSVLVALALTIYLMQPPLQFIPYITAFGLLARMLLYQWIASKVRAQVGRPAS